MRTRGSRGDRGPRLWGHPEMGTTVVMGTRRLGGTAVMGTPRDLTGIGDRGYGDTRRWEGPRLWGTRRCRGALWLLQDFVGDLWLLVVTTGC